MSGDDGFNLIPRECWDFGFPQSKTGWKVSLASPIILHGHRRPRLYRGTILRLVDLFCPDRVASENGKLVSYPLAATGIATAAH